MLYPLARLRPQPVGVNLMNEIESKEEAAAFLLKVLRSPMTMAVKPTRDKAFDLAEKHQITATELLTLFQKMVWNV